MPDDRRNLMSLGYEALNARDFTRVADLLGPEFEFHPSEDHEGKGYSSEGLVQILENWTSAFKQIEYETVRVQDAGEQCVVLLHLCAVPRGAKDELDIHIAHVWRFDGDRPCSIRVYLEPKRAFESIGLPLETDV